jgi:hypothetical protein
MDRYLYLSLTPEALIASMLPPREFGTYMAVGTKKKSRGQAMYFELDISRMKPFLPWDYVERRCVPTPEGEPKKSVYISIYRVIESIPLDSVKDLYLVTNDGRVLDLKAGAYDPANEHKGSLHLYQELGPVFSRIASSLAPVDFLNFMTDPHQQTSVPKLVFTELKLNSLADNPKTGEDDDLPYSNMDHLRDCLMQLKDDPQKIKKTVLRSVHGNLQYRTCINGFFIGSREEFLFYPYPTLDELNERHHVWWRSAISVLLNQ